MQKRLNYQYFSSKKEAKKALKEWALERNTIEELHNWSVNYYANNPREHRYLLTYGCYQAKATSTVTAYELLKSP